MKQQWRKIKSILENHVDPEQEKIRGIKTEIDGKLQKILGFLEEVDGIDDKKEYIEGLIEDIRNHCKNLDAGYDDLTKELKEEFHGSSSSGSDSSDSDDSAKKKGKITGKDENKLGEIAAVVEQDPEKALTEVAELKRKLEAEKDAINLECEKRLLSKNLELVQLKDENLSLQSKSSEIEKALIGKEDEIAILKKKCEDGENATSRVAALTALVDVLQNQLNVLSVEKSEADATISKQIGEISGLTTQIENLKAELYDAGKQKTELVNKIEENEGRMKEQIELVGQLKKAEEEVEQVQDQMRKVIDSKNQDINQLEDTIKDLEIKLEIKEDEINTMTENIRTTEVKQRLTSQKLRITEQVLADKEESHRNRVEMLREEKSLLEDAKASMSACIEAQVQLISEVCEKINETVLGMDTLSVKFEEDFGHLDSRLYEIMSELKVIMNMSTFNKIDQDQLKQELVEQLKKEKEKRFLVTADMEVMWASLQNGDDERTRLNQTVKKGEEKMGELQKIIEERDEQMRELKRRIGEKDSEFLSVIEAKRDAIKQLCIRIDYYQTRYEDLRDMVLAARGRRMQSGA